MSRDGWKLIEPGATNRRRKREGVPPETWAKAHPRAARCELRILTEGVRERGGSRYLRRAELHDAGEDRVTDLGRVDWVDWDSSGDLLIARDGKLLRIVKQARDRFDVRAPARELIDLSPLTFEGRPSPPDARSWKGPRPRGVVLGARSSS